MSLTGHTGHIHKIGFPNNPVCHLLSTLYVPGYTSHFNDSPQRSFFPFYRRGTGSLGWLSGFPKLTQLGLAKLGFESGLSRTKQSTRSLVGLHRFLGWQWGRSTTRPAMSGPLNPSEDIEETTGGKWSREIGYNVAPMSLTLTRTTVLKSEPLGSPHGSAV